MTHKTRLICAGMAGRAARAALLVLVATGALAGTPADTPDPAAEAAQIEAGRRALDSRCSRCHAIGADGASPHAEAPPFREIVRRYPPESLEEALAEGIVSGHPDMPEFILSAEEIGAVIAYLNTLITH